ncbi:hypothetical protein F909_02939 [Acinetobacter sp. ANC 3929]|nr:hypothetical protein F909_02939 [Acinetobacter sp. ANC 3929]
MKNQTLFFILFSSLAFSACAKSPETATNEIKPSPELQQKIQQLGEKTKKNMIFVEGVLL